MVKSSARRVSQPGTRRFFISYSGDDELLVKPLVQLLRVGNRSSGQRTPSHPASAGPSALNRRFDVLTVSFCFGAVTGETPNGLHKRFRGQRTRVSTSFPRCRVRAPVP